MKSKEEIAWQEYRYKYLAKDDPNTVMYRLLFLAGYRAANQPFENMHVDSCTCDICMNPKAAQQPRALDLAGVCTNCGFVHTGNEYCTGNFHNPPSQ